MVKACWLWFVILKKYVELTSPKIESRDPIFFIGTRARSRVSGNDRLFPRGSEFGPNPEIPASPVIQLRPRPDCFSRSSVKFLGHMGWKISDLNQVWACWVSLLGWSQLSNPSDLPHLFSCKMIKQKQLENHLVLSCHFCEAPFLLVKRPVTWISWNWHSYIVVDFIVRTLNPRNSKV